MCEREMKGKSDFEKSVIDKFKSNAMRDAFELQTGHAPFVVAARIDEARDKYMDAFIDWVGERFGGVIPDCGLVN